MRSVPLPPAALPKRTARVIASAGLCIRGIGVAGGGGALLRTINRESYHKAARRASRQPAEGGRAALGLDPRLCLA